MQDDVIQFLFFPLMIQNDSYCILQHEHPCTLLNDYAFKSDLFNMIRNTGLHTKNELKRRAKAILREMESTITSVDPPRS
jgi:hypothetical protein